MIIVSNTSPISNLAMVGKLDLLPQIYQKIIIPSAVYQELTDTRAGQKVNATVKLAKSQRVA